MVRLFLMFMFLQKESFATFKVFKNSQTQTDAELYCESIQGTLLDYGTDLLDAVRHCGVSEAFTSRPWYQSYGCFHLFQPESTKDFSNNHLANCASFCSENRFIFLGVQTTKCSCYTGLVGASPAGGCDTTPCPGNSKEPCGGNLHLTVYRKESTLQNSECQYINVDKDETEIKTSDCNTRRHFVCLVGTATDIECYDENGQTEPPVERTTQPQNLVAESSSSIGVIVGILIAVLVTIAIIAIIIFIIIRKRKKETDEKRRINTQSPRTKRQNSNFINAYNDPVNYHNIRMGSPEPVPIVAFGGDGVDLDSEPALAPVYTSVHKKPTTNADMKRKSDTEPKKQEPAYDEVYQPSNSIYSQVNKKDSGSDKNTAPIRDECTTSFGSYAGITRGQQSLQDTNKSSQNELHQNKLFKESQKQQLGNSDDDLY